MTQHELQAAMLIVGFIALLALSVASFLIVLLLRARQRFKKDREEAQAMAMHFVDEFDQRRNDTYGFDGKNYTDNNN